jgi:hypothetical protein
MLSDETTQGLSCLPCTTALGGGLIIAAQQGMHQMGRVTENNPEPEHSALNYHGLRTLILPSVKRTSLSFHLER